MTDAPSPAITALLVEGFTESEANTLAALAMGFRDPDRVGLGIVESALRTDPNNRLFVLVMQLPDEGILPLAVICNNGLKEALVVPEGLDDLVDPKERDGG